MTQPQLTSERLERLRLLARRASDAAKIKNTRPLLERFWGRVTKTETCWLWKNPSKRDGYGVINLGGKNGKIVRAHRLSYELHRGKIPPGFVLDHLCRNRSCVNPNHLEVVTIGENVKRGTGISVQNKHKRYCPSGHKYTTENTYVRPDNGSRKCRFCMKVQHHVSYLRRKNAPSKRPKN